MTFQDLEPPSNSAVWSERILKKLLARENTSSCKDKLGMREIRAGNKLRCKSEKVNVNLNERMKVVEANLVFC